MEKTTKTTDNKNHIQNLVLAAMLTAVGIVLPFFTGQIPQIGNMLLPMHLPVLVCGAPRTRHSGCPLSAQGVCAAPPWSR